jgi:hypothetical protein
MEDSVLNKKCKGFTQKGIPCRYKPVSGSDYCALHQPKSKVEVQTPEATPVKEPAPVYSGVERISPKITARKTKGSNTLTKAITCIIAVLILLISCCCGLIVGTGSTAWLYEAIEGPCYTQVVVKKFAVTKVFLTEIAGAPAPTYTYYPTYTPLPTLTPPPTQEPLPTTEPPPTTAEITGTQEFTEILRFNGTGEKTTDPFSLNQGIIRVKWNHTGESDFSLSLKRLDTDEENILENATGNAEGQAVLDVEASDQYIFDVTLADGDWEIIVEFSP